MISERKMVDIFFSTIFRYAPSAEKAGELIKLDWENKKVVKQVSIAQKTLQFEDPNPRGNSRGGRGIAVIGDRIVVAGYCELQVFDQEFNFLYALTNNLMAGIHEVFHAGKDQLWITSTTLNNALLLNIDTGEILDQIWPQEIPEFKSHWMLKAKSIDKSADNRIRYLSSDIFKDPNHLHFNAVTEHGGDLFGLFNRFGAVVNISKHKILLEDPSIRGAHNLLINEEGIIFVNDTRNQGVNLYRLNGKLVKRINLLPLHRVSWRVPFNKLSNPLRKIANQVGLTRQQVVSVFHVRGLDVRNNLLFSGISPAAILCVDWKTGTRVDAFDYSDDCRIAIHGLKLA